MTDFTPEEPDPGGRRAGRPAHYQPPRPPGQRPADDEIGGDVRPRPGAVRPGAGDPYSAAGPHGTRGPHTVPSDPYAAPADSSAEPTPSGDSQVPVSLPRFLTLLRPRHALHSLIGHAVLYGVLVLLAVIAMVGVFIGAAIDGPTGEVEAVSEDLGAGGFVSVVTMPFQIVGVWLFGTLVITMRIDGAGNMFAPAGDFDFATLYAPNLLVVGIAMAVAVWIGRRWNRRATSLPVTQLPWAAKLTVILGVSLFSALLVLGLTRLLAMRVSPAELGVDIGMLGHASSWGLFFGAWAVFALTSVLLCTRPGLRRNAGAALSRVVPGAGSTPRVMLAHATVLVLPVLLVTTIYAGVEVGATGVLSFLIWAFTAAAAGFVMLTFGAVASSTSTAMFGQQTQFAETHYLWTSGLDWYVVVLGLVVSVVGLAVAAITWSAVRRKAAVPLAHPLSWVALPVSYLVLGGLITILGRFHGGIDLMGFSGGHFSVAPVVWAPMILLLIGLIIEALARYAAPPVLAALPASWTARLAGGQRR